MPVYQLHGIAVQLPIPLQVAAGAASAVAPAVVIDLDGDRAPDDPAAAGWTPTPLRRHDPSARFLQVWRRGGGDVVVVRFRGVRDTADFTIDRDGRRISIGPCPHLSLETLVAFALGPVLGVALRLQGLAPVHGSAAAVGGRAVLVVGPSGSGKSTLLFGLLQRGARLLSDDLVLVHLDDAPAVAPGLPALRMDAASLERAGADPAASPPAPYSSKHTVAVEAVVAGEVPLAAIFLLAPRAPGRRVNALIPLSRADTVIALSCELYPPFLPIGAAEGHPLFARISDLAARVPAYRVQRPDDMGALPDLCDRLLETLA